jgi:uncharacterized membrane protein YphA (DoxX/SURF4 family)
MKHSQIDQTWLALRLTYGLVAFLAGLDKFFNLLTNWQTYLSPAIANVLPVTGATLMHSIGIVEMAVGILILTRWTRIGAYLASVWLLSIALNLLLTGSFFDIAIRDVAMSVGAWTLARLTELRESVGDRISTRASAGHNHVQGGHVQAGETV